MDKQNAVCLQTENYIQQKEQNPIYYNMGRPWKHDKWKKLVQILYVVWLFLLIRNVLYKYIYSNRERTLAVAFNFEESIGFELI